METVVSCYLRAPVPFRMQKEDTSLYQTLGFDPTLEDVLRITEKGISRAYRKSALKWHPDKNKDNPAAARKFSEVFLSYELLSDVDRRKVYDDKIKAARNQSKRLEELSAGRRKFREDLERQEAEGTNLRKESTMPNGGSMARVQAEIERLRKEAAFEADVHKRNLVQRETPGDKVSDKVSKLSDHVYDAWALVPGFEDFRATSSASFEEFERSVLDQKEE